MFTASSSAIPAPLHDGGTVRLHSLPTYLRQFPLLTGLRFYVADLLRAILDPYSRTAYAQWGEDTALASLLEPRPGLYVEVGANHPQYFSNSFALYRKGWTGISIEANESLVRLHRRCRPRDCTVCAVVSDAERQAVFTQCDDTLFSSLDPSFSDQLTARFDRRRLRRREVTTRTLTSILDEAHCPPRFELLSIDVEGHDFEVLSSLDLARYRPRIVVIEMHGFAVADADSNRICSHMRTHGYTLVGYLATNGYFRDDAAQAS